MNSTAVNPQTPAKKRMATRDVVLTGMFAALLTAVSQISLPMPTGVPVTIQAFGVALCGAVLGWKRGALSTLVYILLGAVGLPVFANFQGGLRVITGFSGGYVLAWPLMAILCGIPVSKKLSGSVNLLLSLILAVAGMLVMEAAGGLQWAFLSGDQTFGMIMAYSFVAFIPKDTVLTVAAVIVGRQIRKTLIRGGYL